MMFYALTFSNKFLIDETIKCSFHTSLLVGTDKYHIQVCHHLREIREIFVRSTVM